MRGSAYETAAEHLRVALEALEATRPNARDYYPQGDAAFATAVQEHRARLSLVVQARAELLMLAENVHEQLAARRGGPA